MKKRQKAEIRKPEIIRNFYALIIEQGFEGASIAKIAKKMEIHPSLIMHYFSTKENMTRDLVDYIVEEYGKLFRKMQVETDDLDRRLKGLLNIYWSDDWQNLASIAGDFEVIAKSFRNKGIYERIEALYGKYQKVMMREFTVFIDAGLIKIKSAERAANIILSMIEGYRHFQHFYVEKKMRNTVKKDMIKAALTILRNGLGN